MSEVIIIETQLNDNVRLKMWYSKGVNEATIKIIRKSAPNLKWNVNATYKADLSYELFKEIAFKFIFVDNPNINEMVKYIEEKLESEDNK